MALVALVALDQLVVRPLVGFLTAVEPRAAELRAAIRRDRQASERIEQVRADLRAGRQRLRGVDAQQVGFRRYLESLVGPEATIRSSKRVSTAALGRDGGLRKLTYELRLSGPLPALTRVLWRLDRSEELLRVDHLEIAPPASEAATLDMALTVSTVARSETGDVPPLDEPVAPASIDAAVATSLPAGEAPEVADIFRPGVEAPRPAPEQTDAFRLAGTVVSDEKVGALIAYAESGETAWIAPGQWLAGMQVLRVTPAAAVFDRDGEEIALAVGQSSGALLAGEPVLAGSFELLGVRTGPEAFALVRVSEQARPRRVDLEDRLGAATVVGIDAEGVTLQTGERTVTVGVGDAWKGGATIQ